MPGIYLIHNNLSNRSQIAAASGQIRELRKESANLDKIF